MSLLKNIVFVGLLALVGCGEQPHHQEAIVVYPGGKPQVVTSCAGGCAVADQPEVTEALTEEDFQAHLATWATESLEQAGSSLALDTLLFHGHRSLELLDDLGPGPLSPQREAMLRRELSRDQVQIEMRLTSDTGEERASLHSRPFPLKEKQHLKLAVTGKLGHLETGGKVKRVGLHHLWSRW